MVNIIIYILWIDLFWIPKTTNFIQKFRNKIFFANRFFCDFYFELDVFDKKWPKLMNIIIWFSWKKEDFHSKISCRQKFWKRNNEICDFSSKLINCSFISKFLFKNDPFFIENVRFHEVFWISKFSNEKKFSQKNIFFSSTPYRNPRENCIFDRILNATFSFEDLWPLLTFARNWFQKVTLGSVPFQSVLELVYREFIQLWE